MYKGNKKFWENFDGKAVGMYVLGWLRKRCKHNIKRFLEKCVLNLIELLRLRSKCGLWCLLCYTFWFHYSWLQLSWLVTHSFNIKLVNTFILFFFSPSSQGISNLCVLSDNQASPSVLMLTQLYLSFFLCSFILPSVWHLP